MSKPYVVPKARTEWWLNKINGNIANDAKATKALKKKGGRLLIYYLSCIFSES